MAGGQERILRRRIRSVQSTKKITRAMELIAASRIVKAQGRVHAARPYSEQITNVIANLAKGGASLNSPLLTAPSEVRTVAYVVLSADRGLCGGYNSGVIRQTERAIKAHVAAGRQYRLVTVGRKAESYFRYRSYDIEASFSGFSDQPSYEDARAAARAVATLFEAGEVDQVQLVFTQFLSAGTQIVVERTLMPLDPATLAGDPGTVGAVGAHAHEAAEHDVSGAGTGATYEFEPEPAVILDQLLPRYVEARLFAALLDASASEHAARQRAMKAATDNADELIKNLARVMNRARQDSITTEIMEIVGGAEALRQSQSGGEDLLIDRMSAEDLFGPQRNN